MCVIGAGAIGSLIAAHVAKIAPVAVLTRRADHAFALREYGLRVSGLSTFTAEVRAATSIVDDLPSFDIGIVATKATEVESAARALEGRFQDTLLVTIQNGLGAEARLRRHGPWPIVAGTTLMGGTRHDDTHVEYELDAPTWLGPYDGVPLERVTEVAALLERAGLKAEAFPDVRPAQWSKLVFNSAVGTISAITGLPHSRPFADDEELGGLVRSVISEGVRVAAAEGIELQEDPWTLNVRTVHDGYSHPPSILLDVRARRRTEADFNIGAIVRTAERLGVAAPLSTTLYRLLKAKETAYA
ncbi:MAG TPA: 2-dehydropantoate 2-reductase [Gaiellaceae bacterium]|nr:2-dehydropantoate 2-reductase [Gaiellaceae bacterium]